MDRQQAITLCRMVKAVCPSQAMDDYTPSAWGALLANIRFEDAQQAVTELGSLDLEPGKARYIEPGHIVLRVKQIRARRIDGFDMAQLTPPPGQNAAEYIDWLKATRQRIGDGATLAELQPATATRPALTATERAAVQLRVRDA